MIMIVQAFVLKLIDNALGTAKTIYINKERYFLGAFFNAMSTFFYLIAIVQLAKNDSIFSIIAMCIATFIGTFLPGLIIKKSERDKLHIYDITANDFNSGAQFADDIRDRNIALKTYISYDMNMNKVLSCKVYCTSKDESKVVNNLIPNKFKYHVYIPINE